MERRIQVATQESGELTKRQMEQIEWNTNFKIKLDGDVICDLTEVNVIVLTFYTVENHSVEFLFLR
jgi:hypothetical protein